MAARASGDNFGYEEGDRYQVSIGAGERVLLPAVRAADDDTYILTNGFSCRGQIDQGTGRRAIHLAEFLALALEEEESPPALSGVSDREGSAGDSKAPDGGGIERMREKRDGESFSMRRLAFAGLGVAAATILLTLTFPLLVGIRRSRRRVRPSG